MTAPAWPWDRDYRANESKTKLDMWNLLAHLEKQPQKDTATNNHFRIPVKCRFLGQAQSRGGKDLWSGCTNTDSPVSSSFPAAEGRHARWWPQSRPSGSSWGTLGNVVPCSTHPSQILLVTLGCVYVFYMFGVAVYLLDFNFFQKQLTSVSFPVFQS